MYVLSYCETLEQWTFTTNAREIHRFSKAEGFACTTDVIHHIIKQFGLTLDQITCVNCYK